MGKPLFSHADEPDPPRNSRSRQPAKQPAKRFEPKPKRDTEPPLRNIPAVNRILDANARKDRRKGKR